ncbi:MAG TPA: MATE family efflux transporter, partial [Chitinophagaceae bacterium]|nr:MATE family efflux transporter [Chitinophagaceae bacterium]
SIAIGISMAATALVARRVGEKKPEEATKAGMQAILLALAITVVISIPGFVFAGNILKIMGAEPTAVETGTIYTRILMGGSVFILLLFLINGIFRGAGDAMMAMKSLWVANICNIILCPLLIRGLGPIPAFGLAGAAMATTIGRGIGVCYQLYHLFNGKGILKFTIKHLRPDWGVIRSLVDIGWPGTLQFLINSGSWIVLAWLVVTTGHSEASAGYQVAIRIIMFFLLPAWGMSNAAATLVGQNLGAKQPERAQESVLKTAKYNVIFMGVVTLILLVFADYIIAFFTQDASVQQYAVSAVRIIGLGFFFYGVGMVMNNAFNGAGDTRTPTMLNFIGFWLFQVPVAYTMSTLLHWGPLGVFIAIPLAETGISISAYILFKRGRWKTVKV